MKRRKLMSLCLALAMALALLPAQARAEANEVTAAYDAKTKTLTVTLPQSPAAPAVLVAACYDASGRMAGTSVRRLTAGASVTQTFTGLAGAAVYRAFLLDAATYAPLSAEGAVKNYSEMAAAKGQVYVPVIDGAVAHATAMAVDAYVEAVSAKEAALSLFAETGETYTTEKGKTEKVTELTRIMREGTAAEKQRALSQVSKAKNTMEQAVRAAAVLDATSGAALTVARAELEECAARASAVFAAADDKQAEALKWAQELSAKWDATERKGKLKNFAEQLGVDARTAYQALTDAQAILSGKYTADAKFYDTCTRVCIGVKTASKVGVYVCATIATGGAASAAGGLTVAETAGLVVGGVDCVVEMERSAMKIVLGDDHKIVQNTEERMKTYDAVMFVAGVATFDPKTATTAEKLLFVEDLVEKNIDAYENVKVCMNEATGLVVDRIEGETKKIAVDYVRVESEDKADLAKAAAELLDASDTGIVGIDPTIGKKTEQQNKDSFTKSVSSDDAELSKTYAKAGGEKTMAEAITEFKTAVDVEVQKVYTRQTGGGGGNSGGDEPGGGGGGGGGDGGGGGGSSGGDGITPSFPDPTMDFDTMEAEERDGGATYRFYKNGQNVGYEEYTIDENGHYWPMNTMWDCGGGDWLVTGYFGKGQTETFNDNKGTEIEMEAERYGIISERYVQHWEGGHGWNFWSVNANYFPNGQLERLSLCNQGVDDSEYWYAPNGLLWRKEINYNTTYSYYDDTWEYYVYPDRDVPYDTTGHLSYEFHDGIHTTYHPTEEGWWVEKRDGQGNYIE